MRETYLFGPYRLDVGARRLTQAGTPIPVTLRGFDLLVVLVRNSGTAVPRSRLLEEVWRDVVVEEGNLDTHVSTLRKALAAAPGAIETVRGFGYRFALEVEREALPEESPTPPTAKRPAATLPPAGANRSPEPISATASEEDLRTDSASPQVEPVVAKPLPAEGRPRVRLLWLGLLVAALGLAIVASRPTAPWRRAPIEAEPAVVGLRSFAVLPFENLSRNADDAWLASALREVLSSEAARSGAVSALPGDTVVRLAAEIGMPAGATLPVAAVAKFRDRLGVDLLLAGTYLVVGPSRDLRVDLQLYDASTGGSRRLWSESGRVDELLALVARAGDELRSELGAPAAVASAAPAFPASSEALRLYTSGLAELRSERPNQALDLFQRALAAQPEFALARGALAGVLGQLGREREARVEAKRALELAGGLPESDRLELEGRLYALTNQWPQAVAVRRQLAARDPRSVDLGLELARALTRSNQPKEALEVLARLAALPAPKGTDARIDLERGWASRALADFDGMRAAGEQAVAKGRALASDLTVAEGLVLVSWADLTLNHWRDGLVACEEGMKIAARLRHGYLIARHQGLCGWNHLNLGEVGDSEDDFRAALGNARANGDLDQATDFLYGLQMIAGNRGRAAERRSLNREQLAIAREAGDVEAEVQALGSLADGALEEGELVTAEATAREALDLARRAASPGRVSNAIGTLAAIRAARGDTTEALALFHEAIEMRRVSTPARAGLLFMEVGWTELTAGRPEAALAAAGEAGELLSADDEIARTRLAALRADALARLGRRDEATAQLRVVEEKRLSIGLAAGMLAGLDLARAQILDRLGRRDEAAALWRDVAKRPEISQLPWMRLEIAYQLARQRAEREPGPEAASELARAIAEVRAAKYGGLLGEKL